MEKFIDDLFKRLGEVKDIVFKLYFQIKPEYYNQPYGFRIGINFGNYVVIGSKIACWNRVFLFRKTFRIWTPFVYAEKSRYLDINGHLLHPDVSDN